MANLLFLFLWTSSTTCLSFLVFSLISSILSIGKFQTKGGLNPFLFTGSEAKILSVESKLSFLDFFLSLSL